MFGKKKKQENEICEMCIRDRLIEAQTGDIDVYVIEGEGPEDIAKQFRGLVGRSYIPPKWAFGYGQSRWSYMNAVSYTHLDVYKRQLYTRVQNSLARRREEDEEDD